MNISRIYRLLRIITLLQSERDYTAGQLAEELQISRRTVFRDFNVLEMARIPYYYDHESQSHRISRHFFMPPVNLTLSEALALLALAGTVQADSNVPLLSQSVQAAVKLESALPQSIREHVGSVIKSLTLRLAPMARHEGADQFFDMLSEAIVHRYICRMEYDSFYNGRTIKVEIQPFRQIFVHRAWYLLGWSVPEKALRTYKLVRIRSLNVTKRVFSEKREKELARHFDQAWTMIPRVKCTMCICTLNRRWLGTSPRCNGIKHNEWSGMMTSPSNIMWKWMG